MDSTEKQSTASNIFGWFPEESATALAQLISENDVHSVIEVGSFFGRSAEFFARHCDRVYCVDTFKTNHELARHYPMTSYPDSFYQKFEDNMKEAGVWDKLYVLEMSSVEAASLPFSADLVYIDGAHDFGNVTRDITNYFNKASKIICGDDYDENWPQVRKAVDEYFDEKRLEIRGRIWIYKK